MGVPYAFWPGGTHSLPGPTHYLIPSIAPSSRRVSPCSPIVLTPSAWVVNPQNALRDYIEHAISPDRRTMCDKHQLSLIESWARDDPNRSTILEVVRSRLDLGWPYNYKALDVLSVLPVGSIMDLEARIASLADAPATMEGHSELKKIAKPLVEKIKGEKAKREEIEAKDRQTQIQAMWGGMWANQLGQQHHQPYGAYQPWTTPASVPVQMAQAPPQHRPPPSQDLGSGAVDGWNSWVLVPVPNPISRDIPSVFGYPRV